MNYQEIMELKAMWKQDNICCDRFAAGYVTAAGGDFSIQESQPLLALDELRQNRILKYAQKMLTGDVGGKIVTAPVVGKMPVLMANRENRLSDYEELEDLFLTIQKYYWSDNNYVVIVFHAVYDVPGKGADGQVQEDAEEVYEYLMCMICPTKVTKTSLAVVDDKVGLTVPDRVIGAPVTGFVWPAFTDRSEDRDTMIIYNADDKKAEHGLYEGLGADKYRTTSELRLDLEGLITYALKQEDLIERCLIDMTKKLGDFAPEYELTAADFDQILTEIGIPNEHHPKLLYGYKDNIEKYHPTVAQLMSKDHVEMAVADSKGSRMRKLLLRAAGVIEDVQGTESELVRDLLTAADMTGGTDDQ